MEEINARIVESKRSINLRYKIPPMLIGFRHLREVTSLFLAKQSIVFFSAKVNTLSSF